MSVLETSADGEAVPHALAVGVDVPVGLCGEITSPLRVG